MHTPRDNYSLGCAGLATATTTSLYKITNAFPYAIDGRAYQKAATDNIAIALKPGATAIPVLAANQATAIFISIDIAGNVVYEPAAVKASSTAAGYSAGAFEWPQETKGYACIGCIKVTTNASGAFTFGTTAYGAANTTVTYYNAGDDYGVAIPF